MLVVSTIEKDFDRCVNGLQKRGIQNAEFLLKKIIQLNNERKTKQVELETALYESNKLSKEIGQLFNQGMKDKAETAKAKTTALKEKSKNLNALLHKNESELTDLLYNIPNIPHESVSEGNSDEENEIVKLKNENIPKLGKSIKPHWELIEEYDIIDFELGNKVTGAGFPFYKGQGARLVRGMVNYFLDQATDSGYYEIQPPILINEASGLGTGQLPDKEAQMYYMQDDDLYMIPTAEVPITNIYRNTILTEDQFPIKNVGHTPCFRREAGSWGSHVRGLNRLHQFDKVEIVQIVNPANSYDVLEEMVTHVESLLQSLCLPYRILRLCAGDLGFASALTYDFEVYSAGQKKWLEVSSVSNFESYQTNRLKLRIKDKDGKKKLAHTLNGSALALPRVISAILENNQEKNHIKMPEVLHSYLGFTEIKK